MKHSIGSKVFAMVLALAMLLSLVPATIFAAEYKQTLTTASTVTSALAPGVTEREVVAYDKNGDRIVYYVVNADIATNPDVLVKANYHDNDNTGIWGKATVVEQANSAKEKRGYNVVASTNAAYYNVSTGQPTGGFVMEGVNINGDAMGNQYEFFAIMKDGTAMIGKKNTFSQYSANIQEAVAGHLLLIWDGKICDGLNAVNKYPRSTVGIKADGNVVLMLADGNQMPYSAGLTFAEQAELMYSLGCVYAIELDGGGSATYAAKLEGTDEVVVRNSCCDGTVRSVSNSLMVISTAVADGTFDHANLSTRYAYYAACSTVAVEAVGADKAGSPADLPELDWSLSDDSFGTISDGIFISNGKLGTVTVQAMVEGKVVGSLDVVVTHPTDFAFSAAEKTVPYGKTSDFTLTAMFNGAEMYIQPDAFDFTVEAGSMDGFVYTAPGEESGVKTALITASYKYAALEAATVTVTFGKGSEILVDFETGDISNWTEYYGMVKAAEEGRYTNGYSISYEEAGATCSNLVNNGIREEVFLASRENGDPVYSGDYALGYTLDYTQSQAHANWQYAYLYYLGDIMKYRDVENGINGIRLGMWMYIPEEAVGLCARMAYSYKNADGKVQTSYLYFTYQYEKKGFSKLTSEKIPEAGWAYVYCDLDDISTTYVTSSYYKTEDGILTRDPSSNYAPAFIQFIVSSSATGAEKCTVYIDDITLDYSDVVDDRDAPIINNAQVSTVDGLTTSALPTVTKYTETNTGTGEIVEKTRISTTEISYNNVTVSAKAVEDTSRGLNYTGLNADTAQIYVDGHKVETSFSNGYIIAEKLALPNGTHDVTFEIADKQGNYTKVTEQLIVNAETDYPVITVTGIAPAVNKDGKLYTGSQYDLLINTDKVEAIDKITTKIWLNSASKWALEHMTVLSGFEATYVLDERACTAEITVERVGEVEAIGEATLTTIPVYAWAWDGSAGNDSTTQWNVNGCAPQVTVSYKVKYGEVIYTDVFAVEEGNYISGFGNVRQDVTTELDSSIANLKNSIGIWHSHTAEAVADLASTCVDRGFEGRTACSVCKSILDWGTEIPANGHTYTTVEGVMKCSCGELLNGEYEGKSYVNGLLAEGWVGDSYYAHGVMFKGVQLIEGFYYDFGENGICEGQNKYTGLVVINGVNHYAVSGSLKSGWHTIDGIWYYFDSNFAAVDGKVKANSCGIAGYYFDYEFVNGKLVSGVWNYNPVKGYRYYYGPNFYSNGLFEIDGKTYYFDRPGYMLTGIQVMKSDPWSPAECFIFDENGVFQSMFTGTGLVEAENGHLYYIVDGFAQKGLYYIDGAYYYFEHPSFASVSGEVYVGTAYNNGLLDPQTREFGEDFKMLQGVVEKEDGFYYYVNGRKVQAGLKLIDGDYYLAQEGGKLASGNVYVGSFASNGLVNAGYYEFGRDGKMLQGVVEKEDGLYYYVKGRASLAGIVEYQDGLYFFGEGGKAQIGEQYVKAGYTNGLLGGGFYEFGEDGKILNGFVTMDGVTRYYEKGRVVSKGQVISYEGELYYINTDGVALTGVQYVGTYPSNGLMTPGYYYEFGEDGKLLNGFVTKSDGIYYYVNGKTVRTNVAEIDGEIYYITDGGKVLTGVQYVGTYPSNGVLAPTYYYEFGEDGKLLDGFVSKADGIYYYVNGKPVRTNVAEIDGEIYYITDGGKVLTGVQYVGTYPSNGVLTPGYYYEFGVDGKLLDGFVTKDDGIYYYVNGKPVRTNVVKLDGDTYYITDGGKVLTGVQYVGTSACNGVLTAGYYYEFGQDGKLLNGLVTKTDGVYYYVNGKTVQANMILIDGNYYYIGTGGKALTGVQYVGSFACNGLVPAGFNYTFAEDGRLIG